MQIKNLLQGLQTYDGKKVDKADAAGAKGKAAKASTSRSDTVSLSEEGLLRGTAFRTAQADPGVRAEKIQKLKDEVQAGTYTPDARKVADKLVREELEIFL